MTWSLHSSRTQGGAPRGRASLSCVGLRGGGCAGGGEWHQSQPCVRDSSCVAVSLGSGAAGWLLWCVIRRCSKKPGRNRHSEENKLLIDSSGGAKAVKI